MVPEGNVAEAGAEVVLPRVKYHAPPAASAITASPRPAQRAQLRPPSSGCPVSCAGAMVGRNASSVTVAAEPALPARSALVLRAAALRLAASAMAASSTAA